MRNYIVKRLLTIIPTLLGISIVIFLIMRMIPGDTITAMIGTQYQLTESQAEAMRAYYGLDKSLPEQYLNWLGNALRGNFGYSVRTGQPVLSEILSHFPLTFEITILSIIFGTILGVLIGVLAAVFRGSIAKVEKVTGEKNEHYVTYEEKEETAFDNEDIFSYGGY